MEHGTPVGGDPRSGRVNMHSEPATAPPASPVAEIHPPPIPEVTGAATRSFRAPSSPRRSPPVRLARTVMSILRGDKYMAGAYPPEWAGSPTAADAVSAPTTKGR
jgi:hypothetical protein